jgi:putative transposase
MTWRRTCPMDERIGFIGELERGERTMSEVCRVFGISRKTGYKWWHRFEAQGAAGLEEHSRAPLHHPNAVDPQALRVLLQLRKRHPDWGAQKLLDWMRANRPELTRPAPSTVAAALKRAGLIKARGRNRRSVPYGAPFTIAQTPNELWSADYKGQFPMGDGRLCYPLTISDGASRYFLCCRGLRQPSLQATRPWFEKVFRTYGLPQALRTDNGAPFASTGLGGLSQLSLWWLKLGIVHERIRPGCPQHNGRHERLHGTLKRGCPVAANLPAQQRAFDRYRRLYNNERPHAALAGKTPRACYQPSLRPYPRRLPQLHYDTGVVVRYVYPSGQLHWRGREWYVSQVLAGEPVGLQPIDDGIWRVLAGPLAIGRLDLRNTRIEAIETFLIVPTLH